MTGRTRTTPRERRAALNVRRRVTPCDYVRRPGKRRNAGHGEGIVNAQECCVTQSSDTGVVP